MVEVTRGCKGDTELIHFVNGTGHFGNSYFDPAVLSNQSITIPCPYDHVTAENLDVPGCVSWKLEDHRLTITIPTLNAHACIVIKEEK